MRTMAGVTTRLIYASSSMMTWVAVTVIYINFTFFTLYRKKKSKNKPKIMYGKCLMSQVHSQLFNFSLAVQHLIVQYIFILRTSKGFQEGSIIFIQPGENKAWGPRDLTNLTQTLSPFSRYNFHPKKLW